MQTHARKVTAWLVFVTFLIVAGVGEWLHCVPGCGHGIRVGNGFLWLGLPLPDVQTPTDGQPRVDRQGRSLPVYDEDQCAICSVLAKSFSKTGPVQLVLVTPLVLDLPPVASCDVCSEAPHSFQARAPPIL